MELESNINANARKKDSPTAFGVSEDVATDVNISGSNVVKINVHMNEANGNTDNALDADLRRDEIAVDDHCDLREHCSESMIYEQIDNRANENASISPKSSIELERQTHFPVKPPAGVLLDTAESENAQGESWAKKTSSSGEDEVHALELVTEQLDKTDSPVKRKFRPSRNVYPICDFSDDSVSDQSSDEKTPRKKKKRLRCRKDQKKKNDKSVNEQPSVYSSAEIRRHKKRLKTLKALESQTSNSDSENSSDHYNVDPDLDINLRIFEASAPSVENVIIGEIQCNVKDDTANVEEMLERINKNTNVFKLSVNANFADEADQTTNEESMSVENEPEPVADAVSKLSDSSDDLEDVVDRILSDDGFEFSDDDSDLEILMAKPIIRKRALSSMKKEKSMEPIPSDKKLTMYDLIYDTMSPRDKGNSSDDQQKENGKVKKKNERKLKLRTEKEESVEEVVEKIEAVEDIPSHLPVPQLKVTADGEVVVDMDSLIIEQTGLSSARKAIANSQVIEESGSNYTSYSKKCNYRKQWSPQDTLKFYKVLSTIGTDFSLMVTLFPGRTRTCMKRKFKREEKCNADLILKALTCRQNFDMDLLAKELRLKEAMVNKMRENTKKAKKNEKTAERKEEENKKKKDGSKINPKRKRQSFFEKSVSVFQTN